MFLSKLINHVALVSLITPVVLQTSNLTKQASNLFQNNLKSSAVIAKPNKHLEPFNPKSFKYHCQGKQGSYFAYYAKNAWKTGGIVPVINDGFIFHLNSQALKDMVASYKWAKYHKETPYVGGMISYLTNWDGLDKTPYSGKWIFDDQFVKRAYSNEQQAVWYAFVQYQTPAYYTFVTNAIAKHQTVDYFFYIQQEEEGSIIRSKVMFANVQSGASFTTKWYTSFGA